MRTLTLLLLAAVPAAHADDLFALQGEVFPVLHKLDPSTGSIIESHPVTGHQALFGGLAGDPAAQLYSIDGYNDEISDRLFSIDSAAGAGTVLGDTRFNWNFRSVCFHPDGTLYAATDNSLYTLNTTTGEATLVANVTGGPELDQLTAIAISQSGQAFISDIGNTDLFTLDLQSGQATWVGQVGQSGNWFADLAFDSAGTLYGARANGGVYTIDTTTAVETFAFFGSYTGLTFIASGGPPPCYPNCDGSTGSPLLTGNDFSCFLNRFVGGESYADCDGIGGLTANDFACFLTAYVTGCS